VAVEFPLRQLNDRAVMEREIVAILEASATGSMTRDSLMAVVALRSESRANAVLEGMLLAGTIEAEFTGDEDSNLFDTEVYVFRAVDGG
jgi:hypothetical protein